jgi:hypothetical protein
MIGTSMNPLPLALTVEQEKFRVTRWSVPSVWVSESRLSISRVLEYSSNNCLPSNKHKSLKDPVKSRKKELNQKQQRKKKKKRNKKRK